MNTVRFVTVCLGILLIPVFMGSTIILIHQVYGQNGGTPTTELTSPNPNLQYVPQKAYIVPLGPNGQVQAIPIQESSSASVDGTNVITGLLGLGGIASAFWAKMTGSRDNKATNNGILQTKEAQIDLAKYTYSIDPVKAAAITDMPSIKLETLEKDKNDFSEKAVKQ